MLANCSLLLGPYFAQNFASKFGQGLSPASWVSDYLSHGMMASLQPIGRSLTLQLIRRNQQCNVSEELAPIDINLQYDPDFQEFTRLPNEVTVLPVSMCDHI